MPLNPTVTLSIPVKTTLFYTPVWNKYLVLYSTGEEALPNLPHSCTGCSGKFCAVSSAAAATHKYVHFFLPSFPCSLRFRPAPHCLRCIQFKSSVVVVVVVDGIFFGGSLLSVFCWQSWLLASLLHSPSNTLSFPSDCCCCCCSFSYLFIYSVSLLWPLCTPNSLTLCIFCITLLLLLGPHRHRRCIVALHGLLSFVQSNAGEIGSSFAEWLY